MCMLIWGFAGRTYHIVGNLMSLLIWCCLYLIIKKNALISNLGLRDGNFDFMSIVNRKHRKNSEDPNQRQHFAGSGLRHHRSPMSHKQDSPLIWFKAKMRFWLVAWFDVVCWPFSFHKTIKCVKQFISRSEPTFCWSWSGSNPYA